MTIPNAPNGLVPRTRTVAPDVTAFSYPKDPQDAAWYAVAYAEPISAVVAVTVEGTGDLVVSNPQIIFSSFWNQVAFFVTGGDTGVSYSLRLQVTTMAGDTLFRTVQLSVATV